MTDSNQTMNDLAPSNIPYAYGGPLISGSLRDQPADFFVEENLGFEPEGEGEHVFLWIEKTDINTQQLAGDIARLAKLPTRQVSYAGMKDRRAVTRQWFSVHLPGHTTSATVLASPPPARARAGRRHSRAMCSLTRMGKRS